MGRCAVCKSDLVKGDHTWKCADCRKVTFCERCYNGGTLSYYGCSDTAMGGECRQCDICAVNNDPKYCLDRDCTCANPPPLEFCDTVEEEKEHRRRAALKKKLTYKLTRLK